MSSTAPPYISEESAEPEGGAPAENVDLALLSDREMEIFRFLGLGNPTRQIAETLGISIKTVQVHCGNIREKLGITGATELLSAAVRWNEHHGRRRIRRRPLQRVERLRKPGSRRLPPRFKGSPTDPACVAVNYPSLAHGRDLQSSEELLPHKKKTSQTDAPTRMCAGVSGTVSRRGGFIGNFAGCRDR